MAPLSYSWSDFNWTRYGTIDFHLLFPTREIFEWIYDNIGSVTPKYDSLLIEILWLTLGTECFP